MAFSSRWRKHAHGTKRAPEWHAGTPRRRTLIKAPKQAVNQRLEQRRAAVGGNRQAVRNGFDLHRPDHPAWNNGITYVALEPLALRCPLAFLAPASTCLPPA